LIEPTLQYFAATYGSESLVRDVELLEQHMNTDHTRAFSFDLKAWSEARKNYGSGTEQPGDGVSDRAMWINPPRTP